MKKIQSKETYDEVFEASGLDSAYSLPYDLSPYYPMYKKVLHYLNKYKAFDVLEVGCGTGAFAKMLSEKTKIKYRGFDFSDVAITKASHLLGQPELFTIGDATQTSSYPTSYETIVCTEVLEHLDDDLSVIDNWKAGALCICSVPNYDSVYHTRFFKTKNEVINRYSPKIEILDLCLVKKPVLSNLSISNYFRELRWNRYKPRRLMEIIGLGNFDKVGGWFIFVGRKI